MQFPDDFRVKGQCTVRSAGNALGANVACSADQIANTFTIRDFLRADYVPGSDVELEVGPVTLPEGTNGGFTDFTITTYLQREPGADKPRYAVDQAKKKSAFLLTPGSFVAAKVTPSSDHAYKVATYGLRFKPVHQVPQYGLIMVEYPPELRIDDPSLAQSLCSDWLNFPSSPAVCTIFAENRTIIVNKGF